MWLSCLYDMQQGVASLSLVDVNGDDEIMKDLDKEVREILEESTQQLVEQCIRYDSAGVCYSIHIVMHHTS
jgi:hypothetical protein